jgi:Spy/CpxP family protein refolding chaperone
MKKTIWILAFILSLFGSQIALAEGCVCGANLQMMLKSMKIESAQKDKIKPILEQLKTSLKESGSQMEPLHKQIDEQISSSSMDESKMNSLIDQKTKIIGDMIKAKAKARNQIFSILNQQQKAELEKMIKEKEDKIASAFKSCHGHEDGM